MAPRVLVLRAPGTNCDQETAFAFERAGGQPDRVHINRLLEAPKLAADYQILCIPGGFSYGDDLSAGRILGGQIRRNLGDAMRQFRDAGKLVLGICNGFQVLMRTGILLSDDATGPIATLALNVSGKYEDRWVELGVHGNKSVFLAGIERMYLPVAHAEGQFITRDEATLGQLETAGQLVLRYRPLYGAADETGVVSYPDNPNGAMGNVAGVCDATGRILGLMPHPERHIDPTHHPRWTREPARTVGDGFQVFRNAVSYFR